MSNTIPFPKQAAPNLWTPTDRDRLVFHWVKFDGHKQAWVADQLGIHQSTVSRMIERYERWIARGGPAQEGSLTHEERLRSQRWLTIERNEWILASALRIAGEMERQIDVSKTTITRSNLTPSEESEIKTYHATLDRTAAAARFLRLAYRVNMDQLKLIKEEPLPQLEPLTIDDLGEDHLPALANCGPPAPEVASMVPSALSVADGSSDTSSLVPNESQLLVNESSNPSTPALDDSPDPSITSPDPSPPVTTTDAQPVTIVQLTPSSPPLHKTHTARPAKSRATQTPPTTSRQPSPHKKIPPAYAPPYPTVTPGSPLGPH